MYHAEYEYVTTGQVPYLAAPCSSYESGEAEERETLREAEADAKELCRWLDCMASESDRWTVRIVRR